MSLQSWALPQLARLLPLDDDSLKQIVTYSDTLPKAAAAEHLKDILGDGPQSLEFIASFNSRRPTPPSDPTPPSAVPTTTDSEAEVPRASTRPRKKKAPIHTPSARRLEDSGNIAGGYIKKDVDDYIAGSSRRGHKEPPLANTLALQLKPDAIQVPEQKGTIPSTQSSKLPPSASGSLISDLPSSRSSSPAPAKTKINIAGGTSMRGQSTTINDLDSAIRSLEMQTNPTLAVKQDDSKRKCNCMAQRHALLSAAPNCLNCGKVICAKEGLGPCTFCHTPLLSSSEVQAMMRVLKEERGKEKMDMNNASHKRAEVARTARPFSALSTPNVSAPSSDTEEQPDRLSAAKQHRDKLLKYQADNAKRTRIHDEAADFETPDAGTSQWASPQERALQLKRQQKVLREQEWSARPDYERRQMVVSIDIVGGKAVKRMSKVERQREAVSEDDEEQLDAAPQSHGLGGGGGTFSRNPLLGGLIRPVYDRADKGKEPAGDVGRQSTWRRVQDDNDDNEQWILDGGAFGGRIDGRVLGAEEFGG